MKWLAALIGCLTLGLGSAAAEPSPAQFRFSKVLTHAAAADEEIIAFRLDSDIYAVTRAGFPDLRVVDQSQAEAPYQLEADVEYAQERRRESIDSTVVSLEKHDNSIEIELRLAEPAVRLATFPEGFTFVTGQTDYERKVQIAGSNDGKDWKPLAEGVIFDYSRYINLSNRQIAVPANEFRRFKLSIGDVTDEKESPYKELARTIRGGLEDKRVERTVVERRTFHIDQIDAWHHATYERVRRPKTAAYPVVAFEVQENAAGQQTHVFVRTRSEPITNFSLETKSRNFNRRAVVEAPVVRGPKTDWRSIGEATISKIQLGSFRREELSISFPEHREEQYRIVIQNDDNPPLDVTGVKAAGNVYRVVFVSQPPKTYRVMYGSQAARAPKYETATMLAALRREDFRPVVAAVGPQVETGDGGEAGMSLRKLLNNWFFLGAVIVLMVVVLGWSLFRAGQRLSELPKE